MRVDLTGQIERITYTNPENGYTIAQVKVRGERRVVTVVGNLIEPMPGEVMELQGRWKLHPKYGEQFEVDEYRATVPATVYGIKKYLGSGLIKGIGPVMADRIVSRFGKKTLDIIENNIEKLTDIDGIGEKRISMIKAAWDDQKEIRTVMMFLHPMESAPVMPQKYLKNMVTGQLKWSRKTHSSWPRIFSASGLKPLTRLPLNSVLQMILSCASGLVFSMFLMS